MPLKYKYASPIRFNPAVSVSFICSNRKRLSAIKGLTRDRLKSKTSDFVGKKYIQFKPVRHA
jgi:hypothetical protein